MRSLRSFVGAACALALAGCEPASMPNGTKQANEAAPARPPAPAAPAANASVEAPAENTAGRETPVEMPEDAPGLAEMSPSRRRAYEAGYRDCSAGRYDPDRWPEAYRIGCGAAQEAQ